MKKIKFFLLIVLFYACTTQPNSAIPAQQNNTTVDGKLWASLFQQCAAEYRALCFQAYQIAQLRVEMSLHQPSSKPRAVITDIDETVLDNSPYAVHQSLLGKDYEPASWADWTSRAQCDTLSGSLSFFTYAASKKVKIFYITNRDEKERAGTLQNLQHYGFPFADNDHLIMKQTTSRKESRRQDVMAKHNVILLLGDNLSDFSALFDKKTTEERLSATQTSSALFGNRFIVLPNPSYGDWESALYQYNYKLTPAQKDSVIKKNVKGY